MRVRANGETVELADGATVVDLLARLGLRVEQVAAAEHNGEALPRRAFAAATLADGDRLELVRAVAGG
jgi:sulfur carrier protein